MCRRGSWRSFDSQWLQDRLCAMQQCTECGDHRARVIEDAQVVGINENTASDDIPTDGTAYTEESVEDSDDLSW